MSSPLLVSVSAMDTRLGRPAILAVEEPGEVGEWARHHREALRAALRSCGCVLVRGLGLADLAEVRDVFAELGGRLMADREFFADRRVYAEGVYSTSRWAATQPMGMHHELSYAFTFPGLVLFACLHAPAEGGATPVADSSAVLAALPPAVVARFARQGWVLTRTYNTEVGSSIADSFGTDDHGFVEAYCRANAIEFAWLPGGGLRTWQRRAAVLRHPVTGVACWFNQVAFFNEWALDAEVREFFVDAYGGAGLPFNTFYGNGEPISPDVVDLINRTYQAHAVREPWLAGDLMLVDNIRCAHGRDPFRGDREVLVAMADPLTAATLNDMSGTGGGLHVELFADELSPRSESRC